MTTWGCPGPGRASGGWQRGDPTELGKGPGAATQPGRAGLPCCQGRGGAGAGPGSPRLPACPGPQPSRASPPPLGAGGHCASRVGEGLPGPPRQLPARPHRRPRWWPSADTAAGRPRSRLEPGQRPWASAQSGSAGGGLTGVPGWHWGAASDRVMGSGQLSPAPEPGGLWPVPCRPQAGSHSPRGTGPGLGENPGTLKKTKKKKNPNSVKTDTKTCIGHWMTAGSLEEAATGRGPGLGRPQLCPPWASFGGLGSVPLGAEHGRAP